VRRKLQLHRTFGIKLIGIRSAAEITAGELQTEASQIKRKSRHGVVEHSGTSGLQCICFNARHITNKTDGLGAWISTWNYDVVAVTETWLKEGQDWQLNIPGFTCFRQDRGGCKRGGGVALLVKENITAVLRKDISEGSGSKAIWAELRNRKGAVTMLGVYYRPPNSQQVIEEQICRQILERCQNNEVVVVGILTFPILTGTHLVRGAWMGQDL